PPEPIREKIINPRKSPWASTDEIYKERFLFHGPAYQGLSELYSYGDNGIDGRIRTQPAPGAVLDNAGQFFGLWIYMMTTTDRCAFPVKVNRVRFFCEDLTKFPYLECKARSKGVGAILISSIIELTAEGKTAAIMEDWTDIRLEANSLVHKAIYYPEKNIISEAASDGLCFAVEQWKTDSGASRIYTKYFNYRERQVLDRMDHDTQKVEIIKGIAAKDAIRKYLWGRGHGLIWPIEFTLEFPLDKICKVESSYKEKLFLTMAYVEHAASAVVSGERQPDIGMINMNNASGTDFILNEDEKKILNEKGLKFDITLAEWELRIDMAKKMICRKNTESSISPVLSDIHNESIRIGSHWLDSCRKGDYIIVWDNGKK
ncbi:MAG: hypothetical protein HQK54_16060, partial [Oligoflexales bacterium]|nr:hypothetical protein [Oligoflexales bacterium]